MVSLRRRLAAHLVCLLEVVALLVWALVLHLGVWRPPVGVECHPQEVGVCPRQQ